MHSEPCSRVLRLNSGTHFPCDFIVSFYFYDKLPERSKRKKKRRWFGLAPGLVYEQLAPLLSGRGKDKAPVEEVSLGKPLTWCQPESGVKNAAAEVNNAISQEMTSPPNSQWTFCLKRKQVCFYLAGDS